MLLRFIRNVKKGLTRSRKPQPRRFRPRLEALDPRLAPTADNWTGAVSTNWGTAGNWSNGVPTSATDVLLGNTGSNIVNNPDIPSGTSVTVNSMTTGLQFVGHTLTIEGSLTLSSDVGTNSTYDAGSIQIASGGNLNIQKEKLAWSGGNISDGTNMSGDIHVDGQNAELDISGMAGTLGAHLWIGYSGNNQASGSGPAKVVLTGMNNNLTLANNQNIDISSQGVLLLSQVTNSGTAGGISGGAASAITNLGLIYRNHTDGGGQTLNLNLWVNNNGSSAKLQLDPGTKLRLNAPTGQGWTTAFNQNAGALQLANGSDLEASMPVWIAGGTLTASCNTTGGDGTSSIGNELDLLGGTCIIGDVANQYETLNVSGAVHIRGGTLQVHVDGSTTGHCSSINATGDVEINDQMGNNATLTVITDKANPPAGNTYNILLGSTMDTLVTQGRGSGDFTRIVPLGQKTTDWNHTPNVPAGTQRAYQLKS